jgi:5-amino-6-(5-phosphoribosylamino)uracil reductase/diaminohydroxyphosphoribosylaminopyrimidine deaminase/5-amino-6-(5-phosphoribosylamino)uracil reductase
MMRAPLGAAVLADGAAGGTILAVTPKAEGERCAAAEALGATVLRLPADSAGGVDLAALLTALGERGIGSVLVEGGARIITGLLRARLAQRLVITVAPIVLGAGIEAVGDLGIAELARALRLRDMQVGSYGADLVLDGRVEYPEDQSSSGEAADGERVDGNREGERADGGAGRGPDAKPEGGDTAG